MRSRLLEGVSDVGVEDPAVLSFVLECRASGRISERTLQNHLKDIDQFRRECPGPLADHTRDDCRRFLAKADWAAATKLLRWKSLHIFFDFATREGFIPRSPMVGVEKPRGAKKARKPDRLTERDMELLLFTWPEWTWMGLRNRAILWSFFTMPFRRAELASLQVKDVDLIRCTAKTRKRKGHDEGYSAQIFPKAAVAIDRYRRKLPPELQETEYLWVSKRGTQMTGTAIYQMLDTTEERAKEAGFSKHFNPHAYRHNWGIQTVAWGLATDVAGETMGHSSDDAAKLYRKWALEDEAGTQVRRIFGLPR